MRSLVFAALALAATSPVAEAQTGVVSSAAPAAVAPVPSGTPLTLDEAINTARRHNPVFQSQQNVRRTADASIRSARGAYLPSADVTFGGRYQQSGEQYFNGAALGASSDAIQGSYGLNLSYRVNRATFVQPRAAVAQREAVEADISGASEQLRAQVTQQYLTVLQAQARSALQDTLVITAQTQLDLAKAKVAVGSGTILDIRRAEVALGQTQVALLRARNEVEVERLRLYQYMGVSPIAGAVLTTDFAIVPPTSSLDSLLDLARRQNPAVLALRSRERAAELNTRVARAAYTPTLSLSTGFGGTSYQYTDANFLVSQAQQSLARAQVGCFQQDSIRVRVGLPSAGCTGPGYTLTDAQAAGIRAQNGQFFRYTKSPFGLSAQLSLPVFDNFSREERVQRAAVEREDAAASVRAKDLALTADVTQAYLTVVTAAQTAALQEQTASKAKEEVAFAEERYRVGASTFLDVVTSRGSYEQALIDRVNAVYEYHKAFASLENAVGRPLR
ncbi:MAG: outer rane efflux protein [Gemmatimonadetes bacterium]|nr:outer rane efflux protein [Gemmatimonadota bacterium]